MRTEDTDYGSVWADTADDALILATAVTDGLIHTMTPISHKRRIQETKNQRVRFLRKNGLFPLSN